MKIRLSKIHAIQEGQSSIHPSLIKLGAESGLPMKKRYWLGRLLDAVISEIKAIEKHRNDLVKKYAGDEPRVPDSKVEAFHQEFNDLLDVEIDLPDVGITLDDLGKDSALNAIDLMSLDWIITETEEPAQVTPKKSKLKAVGE